VRTKPFHDRRHDLRPLRLVQRLVAQVREDAPFHARHSDEWLANGRGHEGIGASMDGQRRDVEPAELGAFPLHRPEQLRPEANRRTRLDQRVGKVGDPHRRVT